MFFQKNKKFKELLTLYQKKDYINFNKKFNDNFSVQSNNRKKILLLLLNFNITLQLKLNKKVEKDFLFIENFINKTFKKKDLNNFLLSILYKNYLRVIKNKRRNSKFSSFSYEERKIPFLFKITFKNFI